MTFAARLEVQFKGGSLQKDGRLVVAQFRSLLGRPCQVESLSDLGVTAHGIQIAVSPVGPNRFEFATQAGETYTLR